EPRGGFSADTSPAMAAGRARRESYFRRYDTQRPVRVSRLDQINSGKVWRCCGSWGRMNPWTAVAGSSDNLSVASAGGRMASASNTAGAILTLATAPVATLDEGPTSFILLQQSSAVPLPHWWCIVAQYFIRAC